MILRHIHLVQLILLVLTKIIVHGADLQDTNEWVPLMRSCATCYNDQASSLNKRATSRVLNVNEGRDRNFFPGNTEVEQEQPYIEQYLRETVIPKHENFRRGQVREQPLPLHQDTYAVQQVFNRQPLRTSPPATYLNEPDINYSNGQKIRQDVGLITQGQPGRQRISPQLVTDQQYLTHEQLYSSQSTANIRNHNNLYQHRIENVSPNINNSNLFNAYHPGNRVINQEFNKQKQETITPAAKPESTVQLLYVPLETLHEEQNKNNRNDVLQKTRPLHQLHNEQIENQRFQDPINSYNQPSNIQRYENSASNYNQEGANVQQNLNPVQYQPIVDHKQQQLQRIQEDFTKQALAAFRLHAQLEQEQQNPFTTTPSVIRKSTTKKRKPHQPPLAVYMEGGNDVKVSDVLYLLKNAKTISVQDNVGPDSPQVFVGPSSLDAPQGYSKFDLPYLSSLESNRVERKVDPLPFFVAPLSYKTPPGYSKIPLPSPHVGSVVVSQKDIQPKQPSHDEVSRPINILNDPQLYQIQSATTSSPSSRKIPANLIQPQDLSEYYSAQKSTTTREELMLPRQRPTTIRSPTRTLINRDNVNGHLVNSEDLSEYQLQQRPSQRVVTQNQLTAHLQNSQQLPTYQISRRPTTEASTTTIKFNLPIQNVEDLSLSYRISERLPTTTDSAALRTRASPFRHTINQYELESINNQFAPQYQEELTAPSYKNSQQIQNKLPHYSTDRSAFVQNSAENQQIGNVQYTKNDELLQNQDNQKLLLVGNDGNNKYTILEEFSASHKSTTPIYSEPTKPVNFVNQENRQIYTQPKFAEQFLPEDAVDRSVLSSINSAANYNHFGTPVAQINLTKYVNAYEPQYEEKGVTDNYNFSPELLNPTALPGLINNLQDQAIRPLLIPALIAPTTEHILETTFHHSQESTLKTSTTPEPSETTTVSSTTPYRRLRGRQRVTRPPTYTSTTTASSRRTVGRTNQNSRQRGGSRYQQEINRTNDYSRATEYQDQVHSTTEHYRSTSPRQRFRTRGRTSSQEITEKISSGSTEKNNTNQLPIETNFQTLQVHPLPESYMQFEQGVSEIKKENLKSGQVLVSPKITEEKNDQNGDLHVTHPISEKSHEPVIILSYLGDAQYVQISGDVDQTQTYQQPPNENTKVLTSGQSNEGTNIPISQQYYETTRSPVTQQYLHSTRAPITRQPYENARTSSVRSRTRTRGHSRHGTTSTTTIAPPIITRKPIETFKEEAKEEEFYGFFKQPNFNNPPTVKSAPKLLIEQPGDQYVQQRDSPSSRVYVSSTPSIRQHDHLYESEDIVTVPDSSEEANIRADTFEGIKSKYYQAEKKYSLIETTPQPVTTYPSTLRSRARIRIPNRKSHLSQTSQEHQTKEYSEKPLKIRGRGRSQYKPPISVEQPNSQEEENYPTSFPKTEAPPAFQITIEVPNESQENYEDDQVPHSSIYQPRVVVKSPEDGSESQVVSEISAVPFNSIPIDKKSLESHELSTEFFVIPTASVKTDNTEDTDDAMETTTIPLRKTGRRRGVWRLRKQRPVDVFEAAESQHVAKIVANSLVSERIKENNSKPSPFAVDPQLNPQTIESTIADIKSSDESSTEESLLDSLYKMFEVAKGNQESSELKSSTIQPEIISNTPQEVTQIFEDVEVETAKVTTATPILPDEYTDSTVGVIQTTIPTTNLPSENVSVPLQVSTLNSTIMPKAWNLGDVVTSTSTEISHETEICYRGRCVKSKDIQA